MKNIHINVTDTGIKESNDVIQLKSWKKQLKECNKMLLVRPNPSYKTINDTLLEIVECRLKQISILYRWFKL